jgi:hypothetical protein
VSNQPSAFDPSAYSPQHEPPPPKKSGCSCVAIGCLGLTGLFVVGIAVMVGGGFWFIRSQVQTYTSDTPADIPVVEYSDEQLEELRARVDSFKARVAARDKDADADDPENAADPDNDAEPDSDAVDVDPVQELALTAEEINALISAEEKMRGRVYVTIEEGELTGDISIPTDGFPGGSGRFLNASATFEVSMDDGILFVRINRAVVKGEPVPESIMEGLRQQNLAKDVYKDEENAEMLRKFESIRVDGDKLILKLRDPEEEPVEDAAPIDNAAPTENAEPVQSTEPIEETGPDDDPAAAEDAAA